MNDWFGNNYWKAEDLGYLDNIATKTIYKDEWWVETKHPFSVKQVVDKESSGLYGYMVQQIGQGGAVSFQGMMKYLSIMDGWSSNSNKYFNGDKEPDYGAPTYKHKETAQMHSNLMMIEFYRKRQSNCKDGSIRFNEYAQLIDMLKADVLEYQDKFPERLV